LSYLPSNVYRTVHVGVHHRLARIADVQATLYTVTSVYLTATTARLARVFLFYTLYQDAVLFGFVLKQTCKSVELPTV